MRLPVHQTRLEPCQPAVARPVFRLNAVILKDFHPVYHPIAGRGHAAEKFPVRVPDITVPQLRAFYAAPGVAVVVHQPSALAQDGETLRVAEVPQRCGIVPVCGQHGEDYGVLYRT